MVFRRIIQGLSLILFLGLIIAAISDLPLSGNRDLFLRMDPALVVVTALSGRIFSLGFIPAIIVIITAPLLGRVFCGYICPMGTTIDGADKLLRHQNNKNSSKRLFRIKYIVLFFLIGAAIPGISFLFISSPISLITRFYGLLFLPVVTLIIHKTLSIIQPLIETVELDNFLFLDIPLLRFSSRLFILAFFFPVFTLAKMCPRFWCRYICPSGAILAIFSMSPIFRRKVSDRCNHCGRCVNSCPMNAINPNRPEETDHRECILCRNCEKICPEKAISFQGPISHSIKKTTDFSPYRRHFLFAGLAGFGTAAVNLTGLYSLYGKPGPGQVSPAGIIRPPGAVTESRFLSLCTRCGECMTACPTNGLQPIAFKAGLNGMFSPVLIPKRGACSPECNKCGSLCPTGAIRVLPIQERRWAKLGTAVIFQERCLAWEHQKSCMVCDEVCPYSAVKFRYEPGNPVAVPEILEDRCAGCGYCEHHCPVQNSSAIIVEPMGALRIDRGSYILHGKSQGLKISLKHKHALDPAPVQDGRAPGFIE